MKAIDRQKLSSAVLKKARELGADAAGIASFQEVKECPSAKAELELPQMEVLKEEDSFEAGKAYLPEEGKSVIIVAISHPEDEPELDWRYDRYSTPGNQKLVAIVNNLIKWLKKNYEGLETYHAPYFIERGGIYLKDAAVMAGLGTIGLNNLLITPEYGSRVRLRGLVVNVELVSTGPLAYDPCFNCAGYCLQYCPRRAFDEIIYTSEEIGQDKLPGRRGTYDRLKCIKEIDRDKERAREGDVKAFHKTTGQMIYLIKHCRKCEFSCPV